MISHHLCSERVSVPTSMVSYYHQVFSLTLTHSLSHPCHPTHTPMVSYYHQVYPLTALRELVLPLTLPWCRTTTKSSHTHTNPCAPLTPMSSHTLLPHFISPPSLYKCITNSSQLISHTLPPIMPPSHHHHFLSPITTNHHQSLPLTPYNTPNPSISLPTLPIVS